MKKILLTLTCALLLLIVAGCPSNGPSHKDTFILATRIAINHLGYEKDMAIIECEEDNIPEEECEDANEFKTWIKIASTFEDVIKDSNDLELTAEEIAVIIDVIIEEMIDEDVDPRTRVYIEDLKDILEMMIKDYQTKAALKLE